VGFTRMSNLFIVGTRNYCSRTPGLSDLMSLSRGIYENEQPIYSRDEELLFEAKASVKSLITELENSEIQIDEDKTQ